MRYTKFSSLAVVPFGGLHRAVGVVVVNWLEPRTITKADRSFLFTMTGAAAQAVERARLTLTEFANLEQSQQLQDLGSALAAATTPGDVARDRHGRRTPRSAHAIGRVPSAERSDGHPALTCLATSGRPAVLSTQEVHGLGTVSGAAMTSGRTSIVSLAPTDFGDPALALELDHEGALDRSGPLTLMAEPLTGNLGPLGVLVFAFVEGGEPGDRGSIPQRVAGLTSQALGRAQLFEQERQALRDAESARERLSLLSDVTKLLSSSLNPTTVIHRTMNLVVGRVADACVVEIPSESGLARLDVGSEQALDAEHRCNSSEPTPRRLIPTHRPPSPFEPGRPSWLL